MITKIILEKTTKNMKEIKAEELNVNDIVYTFSHKKMTFFQEQLVLGSILGDAYFGNEIYEVAHSIKQKEYLDLKIFISSIILSNL